MKKSREEWKKQLDARFQDIDRYDHLHTEKSKAASSTSPAKQKEPTILFWPFSTSSNQRSKKLEKIFRATSINYLNPQKRNLKKRTRKWHKSTRSWLSRRKQGTANTRKDKRTQKKK